MLEIKPSSVPGWPCARQPPYSCAISPAPLQMFLCKHICLVSELRPRQRIFQLTEKEIYFSVVLTTYFLKSMAAATYKEHEWQKNSNAYLFFFKVFIRKHIPKQKFLKTYNIERCSRVTTYRIKDFIL